MLIICGFTSDAKVNSEALCKSNKLISDSTGHPSTAVNTELVLLLPAGHELGLNGT